MNATSIRGEYVSAAELAKLIRAALKRRWPDVKFSVRSETYSGGSSVNVRYAGIVGYKPLAACYCVEGPETVDYDPNRCRRCGYIGRLEPIYAPGMPTYDEVRDVAQAYQTRDFDGSIDLGFYASIALDAQGEVVGSRSGGTQGSRGSVSGWDTTDTYRAATTAVRHIWGSSFVFVEARS